MNRLLLIIALATISFSSFSQEKEQDTVITKGVVNRIRLNWGMHFGFGFTGYSYGDKTKKWIGNHKGATISFIFNFKKHNVGLRFKPATVHPKGNLVFGNDTLTSKADFNVIKTELFYGYDVEVLERLFIEPYVGYSMNSFIVINQEDMGKKFSIPSASGFAFGLEIKKYLQAGSYSYLIPYFNIGEALIDFKKVNNNLDDNYLSWEIGLRYGGWFTKKEISK